MSHSQLYPLEINSATGEPFFRLPSPNDNIIITPPRAKDEQAVVPILNDPGVYQWLEGPPFPYTPEHAASWIPLIVNAAKAVLDELKEEECVNPGGPLKAVGDCPVRMIREVKKDGTDVYIGDIGFRRCLYEDVLDPKERKEVIAANDRKEVGDPTICWSIGNYLAPSHHGRGIMSMAFGLLLGAWAIPRMKVRSMRGYTFVGNTGSVRVFEKNGYILKGIVDNGKVVRGEKKLLNVLYWNYQESKSS
ncbi:hypothetical protein SERLA73DRAFT_179555 [Serpula lacrymans var. lacrymans S7.3]|uniref:N-acetyltransferase domain-containing protein n=1 Tax=Serpula lacrymans var. lacrymans (strain S7.3) TaxID=936435 RepID=F8PVF9_SERL3|nr:hypothetical protein SERLA73DRAFT_179555 [Serpula lacrymans var. lacrymans S7.3]